jgi:cytochrome c-type biogenesis protein CcmH/NrfF
VAGSNAQQAVNLRAKIVQLVDDGATNSAVEAYVVSQFGTDELLRPSNSWLWALPIAGCGAGAIAVVGFLWVRSRDVAKPVRATEDERLVAVALGREMPAGELQ